MIIKNCKFKNLGHAEKYDETALVETILNKVIRELKNREETSKNTYNRLKYIRLYYDILCDFHLIEMFLVSRTRSTSKNI